MTLEFLYAQARRALPWILAGTLLLGGVGLLYSLLAPRIYQATARVVVEPRGRGLAPGQEAPTNIAIREPGVVDTEVEFLESGAVAARVVGDLGLRNDPEFGGESAERTIDEFQKALRIRRAGTTYLIDISVDSRSPERAAALANATARAYTQLQRERKRSEAGQVNRLLRDRVETMAGEVRGAEAEVQRYRVANNLLSVNGATLAEQSAASISDQLAVARAAEAAAAGELAAAQRAGSNLDAANAQSSLGTLRAQQSQAMQEMSAAEARYGARHPSYVAARQRLGQINEAIAGETGRARQAIAAGQSQRLSDLRAKAAAASDQRRSLEASSGANQAGLQRNSRAATQLAELERRAAALRTTYEAYLNRYQQTQTQLGTEQADAALVSPASVPLRPYKPDTMINVALGLLAGLLAGLSASVLMALLAPHLTTAEQVEAEFDLEALPSLPTAQSAGLKLSGKRTGSAEVVRAMLETPTSAFAEMHKNLLASINRPVDGKRNQVVAITSALPKEGKTTASLCLAAMSAHTGRRTILIDCDQRRRSATRAMMMEPERGLREVLTGAAPWRSAVLHSPVPNLDLLPASAAGDAQVDIFGGAAFAELIRSLRQAYDLVLLDTAPVLPIADTRLIAPQVDSVLFMARWASTSRRAVEAALTILGRADAPIAGVSLTMVDLRKQSRQGYGDPAFYYRKYKDYYTATA